METTLLSIEQPLRLGVYFGLLVLMAVVEALWPQRERTLPRGKRWLNNIGVAAVNSVLLALLFPVLAVGLAAQVWQAGSGLLPALGLPYLATCIIAFFVFDLLIWAQHVLFHKVPVLWRLHRVHHMDLDFDTTTGVRFHPVEIILSMCIKLAAVWALAPPPEAILIFEVVLNGAALFNHANLRLPPKIDRALQGLIITPDMHRVHHSTLPTETNSNYGFSVSLWDRLFKTYIPAPRLGQRGMSIGLDEWRAAGETIGLNFLTNPFRDKPSASQAETNK